MDVLLLARLQFTITTVFHFFYVPLTLGLSIFVAILETMYVRTGNVSPFSDSDSRVDVQKKCRLSGWRLTGVFQID